MGRGVGAGVTRTRSGTPFDGGGQYTNTGKPTQEKHFENSAVGRGREIT